MPGRRVLILALALAAMLATGHAVSPAVYRTMVLNPKLADALDRWDLKSARHFIVAGADINMRLPQGDWPATALGVAAVQSDTGAIDWLLQHGADVDLREHNGATPLMLASMGGTGTAIPPLLLAGADIAPGTTPARRP